MSLFKIEKSTANLTTLTRQIGPVLTPIFLVDTEEKYAISRPRRNVHIRPGSEGQRAAVKINHGRSGIRQINNSGPFEP